jgi:hypothetical protein
MELPNFDFVWTWRLGSVKKLFAWVVSLIYVPKQAADPSDFKLERA